MLGQVGHSLEEEEGTVEEWGAELGRAECGVAGEVKEDADLAD